MTTLNSEIEQLNERLSENGDEYETESIDPRVQIELERLNKSSCDINKMENELEEAKQIFTNSKNRQLQRLEYLQKKLGSCITRAKPYYEALVLTDQLQNETQKAVQEYQRANSLYKTAKETLSVAEHNLMSGEIPDVWQEHLSTTITRINMSKKTVDQAEEEHRKKAYEYQNAEQRCQLLEKDLKRSILKSQIYYDEKMRWNIQMEAQKARIDELENAVTQTKVVYKEAMKNLSKISEEIHNKRNLEKQKCSSSQESSVNADNSSICTDSLEKQ